MRLSESQKKGAGWVLAGLVGYFTGEWIPPEVLGNVVGGLVGLV